MDEEAPTGGHRRGSRRWKRWFIALALLSLAGFGLSNLILNSRWALAWISGKIHQRTTLEASIGGASWSPWNGITLRDVTIAQPAELKPLVSEPLLRVSRLVALPAWEAWIQGQLQIRDLRVVSPKIVLPLELVSSFAPPGTEIPALVQQDTPPPAESPSPDDDLPPLASAAPIFPETPTTTISPELAGGPPAPPVIQPGPAGSPAPSPAPEAAQPPTASPATPVSPGSPPPVVEPPLPAAYIHLEDASFTLLFAATGSRLAAADGITGSIPVAGGATDSSLKVGAISFFGNRAISDLRVPLKWETPVLSAAPTDIELAGLKTKFLAQIAVGHRVAFNFEAVMPNQEMKATEVPGIGTCASPDFGGSFRFRGVLLSPASWQAEFISAAARPVIKARGHENIFDQARVISVLRGGTLSCVDARLIGDELSFLGNATILSNGRAAGVLRIVAPPATTMSIVQQVFPGLKEPPAFSAMSTPQRAALDLEAAGTLGNIKFRVGKNGPIAGPPAPPAPITPP